MGLEGIAAGADALQGREKGSSEMTHSLGYL